jgi:hypothetical protein
LLKLDFRQLFLSVESVNQRFETEKVVAFVAALLSTAAMQIKLHPITILV